MIVLPSGGNVVGFAEFGASNWTSPTAHGYSVAHTYGALPDPYTASAAYLTGNPSVSVPRPLIALRAV
jgi:hypothetical protein